MDQKHFYQLMREGEMVTTSAVNVHDFEECLVSILESGKDVLVMPFDAAISSTYQSAAAAVETLRQRFPQRKLLLEDTRCVTAGLYLLLRRVVELQRAGASIEEAWQWCEDHKYQVCHCFTVEDLKYLRRGGRISAATAVVGGMLNIKPILHTDHDGFLTNIGKVRGRHAAMKGLVDLAEKYITDKDLAAICHADCLDEAQQVAQDLKDRVGVKEVVIGDLGPVIGAHTGPGLIVLGFFGTERTDIQ